MNDLQLNFNIDFIKRENRIVSGVATADNIDKSGDVVTFEASLEAFNSWAGNIREMHAPIAVGKAINFEPVDVMGSDGQVYKGIRVDAYISKGAQDTWEKVLDGTLRSFSIGGKVLERSVDTTKMYRGKPVRKITKYALGELSLVDNPANPVAVIDIVKFENGSNELDYVLKIDCGDIDLSIPESVQRAARAGLNQRKEHGRGGTSVGLASARRLAAGGTASPEFVRKVARYFPRHEPDLRAEGADPGEDGYPSNGRIAWNLWGGTPGWQWARSKVRQLDNCTQKFDSDHNLEKDCGCGCEGLSTCGTINELDEIDALIEQLLLRESMEEEIIKEVSIINTELLQNENIDANVSEMETSAETKLSLLKRFVNWLTVEEEAAASAAIVVEDEVEKSVDTQDIASTELKVEAEDQIMEDQMDIDMLKDALGSVIDQKLTDFAASLKEEVEASVTAKIDELAKSFDDSRVELADKLATAEALIAEQQEKVDAFAGAGAIKKSVDPDDDDEELVKSVEKKSFWDGVYLPKNVVNALGYES